MDEPFELPLWLELDEEFGLDHMSYLGRALAEEMLERKWNFRDVALRMVPDDATDREFNIAYVTLYFAIYYPGKDMRLDPITAKQLGRAFDVEPDVFLNLDGRWRGRA